MLKHKYAIAAACTGISVLASAFSVSADTGIPVTSEKPCSIHVINSAEDWAQLKEKLEELGINCPNFELPGQGTPETPEAPDTPETEIPEEPETPDQGTDVSYAMQVIHLVNAERAKAGLPALAYNAAIEKAALVRAKETEVSFSHTRPNGSSFSTALNENGVTYRGAGENIAWGQKSPEEVMKGWMNSPGHRANILNRNFTKIGVGYYQNSNGVNYWTQLFTS